MSRALDFGVRGVGLVGPGLPDWTQAAALLRAPGLWQRAPTVVPAPELLPATERRRAGLVVKASVDVADAACRAAGADPAALPTVFTSSSGDPVNCHMICEALAGAERLVSPTRFTNSVHNVAAGYWHIATRSMQPSTSLCAFDASFAAGLLEAAAQCALEHHDVLLVSCDVPYPAPLHAVRPLPDTLALALLLTPRGGRRVRLTLGSSGTAPTRCADPALDGLRRSLPSGRALPLLQALAGPRAAEVVVEGLPDLALAVGDEVA